VGIRVEVLGVLARLVASARGALLSDGAETVRPFAGLKQNPPNLMRVMLPKGVASSQGAV
jgi:hypothetical protein